MDWKGEFGLFHNLAALAPADVVQVGRADDSVAVFAVTRVEHYPKDAFPSQAVYGATDDAELRLITCGGVFDRARRSYRDNTVVYADLVDARS